MYNLYLDDWREPIDTLISKKPIYLKKIISENEWEIVRNYHEFVDRIQRKGLPNIISFDHDLGENYYFLDEDGPKKLILLPDNCYFDCPKYEENDERTGYHCVKWLTEYCMEHNQPLPKWVIHSDNTVGSKNMQSYLENFKKHIEMEWFERGEDYVYDEHFIKGFFGENRWLSNYHPCEVVYEGRTYLNSEAAYQAAKTLDLADRVRFETMGAGTSKRQGQTVVLRDDWEEVKIDVMKVIVYDKFFRNEDLRDKLIGTGDRYLEETNWWEDKFWGVCKGVGRNELGKILMEIRYDLTHVKL